MYDAIVLAGGKSKEAGIGNGEYEALLNIGDRPMLYFVVDALRKNEKIGDIFVVGAVEVLSKIQLSGKVNFVSSGLTIMDTVKNGIDAVGGKEKVLIVTADLPFLTAEAIDDFLLQCESSDRDFYYPIINKLCYEAKYAKGQRTYAKLTEGTFTGGNIFLLKPEIVETGIKVANEIVENRKKPWRLARQFGLLFLLQFVLGTLSLGKIEQRFFALTGIDGAVVHTDYAEIGMDVDKAADLRVANEYIQSLMIK